MARVRFLDQVPVGVFQSTGGEGGGTIDIYKDGLLVSSSVPILNFSGSVQLSQFNTTGVTVDPANYKIILESIDTQDPTQVVVGAPVVQIFGQVSVGNELTITSIVGRLAYINGEQIGFRECNLEENTISLLVRGANGTGVQNYSPEYTEVYGLIPSNAMSDVLYSDTWNPIPGLYNPEEGDPLQIADTSGANFLRTDRN
jgi:hypothetical protein